MDVVKGQTVGVGMGKGQTKRFSSEKSHFGGQARRQGQNS